ncbi:MAG TPA: hypothetical protein VIA80_03535 [Hyphomonadaceae bacterium]|jgi:hypothetical protein
MRISASILCLAATLAAAPAFAQAKDGEAVSGPQTLASQPSSTTTPETQLNAESPRLNLGASFNKGTETSVLPLAPIEKDQLELSWKPGGKWGITLDLTSRSENDILPKEEFAAGLSYQVTPRFRFGGGVTLKGDSLSKPMTTFKDEVSETTVRVESAFSF